MLAHLRSQVVKIDMCVKIKGIFTVFTALFRFVNKIDKNVGGFSSKLGSREELLLCPGNGAKYCDDRVCV